MACSVTVSPSPRLLQSFDHAIVGDWLGLMTHAGANVANLDNSVSVVYAHEALATLGMTPGAAVLEVAGWPDTYGVRASGGAASASSGTSLVPAPSYVAPDVQQIVHGLRFATKVGGGLLPASDVVQSVTADALHPYRRTQPRCGQPTSLPPSCVSLGSTRLQT